MGLYYVHQAAHAVCLTHVYNDTVAETFLGDELLGADRTIPIEDQVDKAVKRFQKLSATTKAIVGQTSRGSSSSTNRGGAGRRGGTIGGSYNGGRQPYDRQDVISYYDKPYFPLAYDCLSGGSSGIFGSGGCSKDNGQHTLFICGSTGHHAKQCLKA